MDNKGNYVGAPPAGRGSYHAVLPGLKPGCLDGQHDRITIPQSVMQAARVGALQSGGDEAIIVNPGLGAVLKQRGNAILADFTVLPIAYQQQTTSVRERTSNPDFAEPRAKPSSPAILQPRPV